LQYRILKLIAAYHKNLFVVGDDAQSIYGFRGADIRNFRYLEKDFSPVTIIRLEQNYRSTPQILEVANALLKHSKELYPKRLFTKNAGGPKPYLQTGCLNVQEEASFVVKKIREEVARHHLSYRDFAVLYRTNAYSRAFEEAFRAARIPYRLVGTISFYQREEVKHLLAFLRFLVNPHDEQALLRVLVVVGEGIGESSLERMRKLSMERGESLWAVWPEAVTYLKGPAQRAAEAFYVRMWRFRENCLALPLPEQVERVLYEGGLWNYYEKDDRAQERWDNLRELVGAAQEFALQAGEQASLRDFLERAALSSSTDDPSGDPPEAVWLSTVHGVKGLEFHTVFLVGVIEGLFPHGYAHEQGIEALEEERRIFYVALTRASRHLYLTQPQYDMRFREQRPAVPSRFLREIGLIEEPLRPAVVGLSRNWNTSSSNKVPSSVSPLSFVPTDPAELQPGCWVEHSHFGRGRILSREENGSAGVIQVQFDTVGVKKLDLRYAKLRRVS
jgi:DNA helicase-2/ATP-dependent DNA helicase PcrA